MQKRDPKVLIAILIFGGLVVTYIGFSYFKYGDFGRRAVRAIGLTSLVAGIVLAYKEGKKD